MRHSLRLWVNRVGWAALACRLHPRLRTYRYITVFKYSDTAMKAMTENPQDRGAAAAKLAEAFGGKMEAAYWFSSAGDYDGMVVWLLPNDQAAEALNIMTRASGNFSNTRTLTATRSIDRTSVSRRRQKPCLANSAPRSVL
jgi:uncharacterized protein with GYD domain